MTAPYATAAAVPFPFATLESLTRADVASAARLRRVARDYVKIEALEAAASELVGEPVRIALVRHRKMDAPRGADDAIGVVLATSGARSPSPSQRVLVEVDGALGSHLVARALRQKAPRVVDAGKTPSPAIAGALAAVLIAVVRRAHSGLPAKVVAAGPGAELARDLLLAERDVTTTWLAVTVGDDAFEARVSVPDVLAPSPRAVETLSHVALARMGDAKISIPLVVTSTLASRMDLAALARGDVFVPSTLALVPRGEGVLTGTVALVPPRSERGIGADLAEDGRLVVRGELESHPWERQRAMSSDASQTATMEVLEQAPVVVRVELGAVEMTAREWADLGPGDVVTLGRKVGDLAILRVGGVELARGELVQVDGEYGVRIVARSGAGDAR